MRKILAALLAVIGFSALGANPDYKAFTNSQFSAPNGGIISITNLGPNAIPGNGALFTNLGTASNAAISMQLTNASVGIPGAFVEQDVSGVIGSRVNTHDWLRVQSPNPPLFYTTWGAHQENATEQTLTNDVNTLCTNGMAAFGYTNIIIDDGWQGARDGNGNFTSSVNYPSGISNVVRNARLIAASHGFALNVIIYTAYGTTTSCAGFPGTPFNRTETDIRFFLLTGFDGVKVDICNVFPNYLYEFSICQRWGDLIRKWKTLLTGFVQYDKKFFVQFSTVPAGDPSLALTSIPESITELGNNLESGFLPTFIKTYAEVVDQAHRQYTQLPYLGQGRWPELIFITNVDNTFFGAVKADISLSAMMGAEIVSGIPQSTSTNLFFYTNSAIEYIRQNLAQPKIVFSNSIAEMWYKGPLSNGSYAVTWVATQNTNVNFYATNLGLPSGTVMTVSNIWRADLFGPFVDNLSRYIMAFGQTETMFVYPQLTNTVAFAQVTTNAIFQGLSQFGDAHGSVDYPVILGNGWPGTALDGPSTPFSLWNVGGSVGVIGSPGTLQFQYQNSRVTGSVDIQGNWTIGASISAGTYSNLWQTMSPSMAGIIGDGTTDETAKVQALESAHEAAIFLGIPSTIKWATTNGIKITGPIIITNKFNWEGGSYNNLNTIGSYTFRLSGATAGFVMTNQAVPGMYMSKIATADAGYVANGKPTAGQTAFKFFSTNSQSQDLSMRDVMILGSDTAMLLTNMNELNIDGLKIYNSTNGLSVGQFGSGAMQACKINRLQINTYGTSLAIQGGDYTINECDIGAGSVTNANAVFIKDCPSAVFITPNIEAPNIKDKVHFNMYLDNSTVTMFGGAMNQTGLNLIPVFVTNNAALRFCATAMAVDANNVCILSQNTAGYELSCEYGSDYAGALSTFRSLTNAQPAIGVKFPLMTTPFNKIYINSLVTAAPAYGSVEIGSSVDQASMPCIFNFGNVLFASLPPVNHRMDFRDSDNTQLFTVNPPQFGGINLLGTQVITNAASISINGTTNAFYFATSVTNAKPTVTNAVQYISVQIGTQHGVIPFIATP